MIAAGADVALLLTSDVIDAVDRLNQSEAHDGILVQSPLPTAMGEDAERRVFDPAGHRTRLVRWSWDRDPVLGSRRGAIAGFRHHPQKADSSARGARR
jgi:hypothetical protein